MNEHPPPASISVIETTKVQAFKELRSLLSEVLASAVADEEVPDAFKSAVNWEKLISQTESRLADAWKHRFEAGADRRQAELSLNLLPDDEHQQQVLSERFVNDVSYQDRLPLDQLDRQLASLSGQEFDSRTPNPLGPSSWVEGLRGGMKLINCTAAERDWLLQRLIPLLTARMGVFYSALNSRLTSAGVTVRSQGGAYNSGSARSNDYSPELVPVERANPLLDLPDLNDGSGESGSGGGFGGTGNEEQGDAAMERLFSLLSARRAPAPDVAYGQQGGAWPQSGPGNFGWPGPGFGQGGQPGFVPAMPEGYGQGAPQGYGQGVPQGYGPGIPQGFGQFVPQAYGPTVPQGYGQGWSPVPLSAGPAAAGSFGEPGGNAVMAAPVAPWSQADIFSILSLLQNSYAAGPAGAAGASSMGRLQEAMSSTASQLGLPGEIQAMPGPAQDMLELVSMLFEALLDGRRLDEKARAQLARLIIPYVRVALLDRRLFMQSSHPARRVLNQLVEAFETAAPDVPHFRSLRELGFKIIDQVVDEFADDVKFFEPLEATLSAELDACRRRAELAERRAADAQSGRERRQAASKSVIGFLKDSIVGKDLPTPLRAFLAGPWQHHQIVMLLREGELGAGVLANRDLLHDLLDCAEKKELRDSDSLRSRLMEVLASSGQTGSAAGDLLSELATAFASAPDQPAVISEQEQKAIEESIVAAALADEQSVSGVEQFSDAYVVPAVVSAELPADVVERYKQAPIGTWLDFIGDDGRVTSSRISWTSPISGRRILSNRRGQRILVASPQELAEMELEGRIRVRESDSAFDQALHAIADRLESAQPGTPG